MRGAKWTGTNSYELAESAIRFEDWEFAYALVLGVGEATKYARAIGVGAAQRRAWMLAENLRSMLSAFDGVRVLDRGRVRSAIVTAEIPGWYAPDLSMALRKRGINSAASLRWYG